MYILIYIHKGNGSLLHERHLNPSLGLKVRVIIELGLRSGLKLRSRFR